MLYFWIYWMIAFLITGLPVSPHIPKNFYGTHPVLYGSFLWLHITLGLSFLTSLLVNIYYKKRLTPLQFIYIGIGGFIFQICCDLSGVYKDVDHAFCKKK